MLVDEGLQRNQATIQIQRGNHSLDAVGQQGKLLPAHDTSLSPPQPQVTSQVEYRSHLRQVAPADQAGTEACPLAFVEIGKTTEENLGDDQAQNCVSQELQLLVIFLACAGGSLGLPALRGLLVRQRAMGQRLHQQCLLAEGVTQRYL